MTRKAEYEKVGMRVNWKLRGLGFLYSRNNMILAARVHSSGDSVHIFNVLPQNNNESSSSSPLIRRKDDCDKLTLWVRVYGPEIFAGSAQTVPATEFSDCYWKFDFEVRLFRETLQKRRRSAYYVSHSA
jgi:hypothetical protein